MATINNDFNRCQINETIEKDVNGNVYKRSLMLNIRANEVSEAEELYRDLKSRLNGVTMVLDKQNNKGNGKKVICECGGVMKKRSGSRGEFFGCSNFPRCTNTKQLEAVADIKLEAVPF